MSLPILNAIRQIRGVLSVEGNISDPIAEQIIEMRVRRDLGQKLWDVIYPERS